MEEKQLFGERFVFGERCNSAPFLFILQRSTSPQTRRLLVFLPHGAQPLTTTTVKVPATAATIFSYHKTNGHTLF